MFDAPAAPRPRTHRAGRARDALLHPPADRRRRVRSIRLQPWPRARAGEACFRLRPRLKAYFRLRRRGVQRPHEDMKRRVVSQGSAASEFCHSRARVARALGVAVHLEWQCIRGDTILPKEVSHSTMIVGGRTGVEVPTFHGAVSDTLRLVCSGHTIRRTPSSAQLRQRWRVLRG